MSNEAYIKNGHELIEYFSSYNRLSPLKLRKELDKGIMVTAKVRRHVLTSSIQGRMIFSGRSCSIRFQDIGGGVWIARLSYLTN